MKDSFEENLNLVYKILEYTTLDNDANNCLENFMQAYNQTLHQYLNLNAPNLEISERLKALSGPVQQALSMRSPGALYIQGKLNEQGMEMEKPFTKTLKNPNVPSMGPLDEMNGFSLAIILVCFTIVLGIVLGALLFVIK